MKIFYNGKIYSMDKNNAMFEALVENNGVILSLGSSKEIIKEYSNYCESIDLKGNTVLPGFNDSHVHFVSYANNERMINLGRCKSINDVIEFGKKADVCNGWISGRGWNQDLFSDKRMLTKRDLNKISIDVPICFTRCCGHLIVVNEKALEVCGVTKNSSYYGGTIDYDSGTLTENALDLIYSHTASASVKEIKDIILLSQKSFLERGITSVQSDDFRSFSDNDYKKVLDAYQGLKVEGLLKIRVYEQSQLPSVEIINDFRNYYYSKYKDDDIFSIGPIKIILDGSLGARTAFLRYDYADDKGNRGVFKFSQNELDDIVSYADHLGYSVAIHAIGDGAIDMALNSFENIKGLYKKERRHGIVHCQITTEDIIERIKKLNSIVYIQPIFLDYDMHIVESRVGEEKSKKTYAYKTILDKGIQVSFGSDGPIDSISVIYGIHSAVNRQDRSLYPQNGWLENEKISVKEAVYCYTMGGAYSSFSEDKKGSLESGKLADFVILDRDIFNIDKKDIIKTNVIATIIGGDIVYGRL